MKCLHIKNLEEYNPGYKDRELIWCKVYFKMLNADDEFEMLCEIDKWRFTAFVMIELQIKRPVPLKEDWLARKGFDFKKRSLGLTLGSLMQSIEITDVTEESQVRNDSVTQSRVETSREEERRVEGEDVTETLFQKWNTFAKTNPKINTVLKITPERRAKLNKRLAGGFDKRFDDVLAGIAGQPFLMGENERGWTVTFDWLIENDTNYVKILEKRYVNDNGTNKIDEINRKMGFKNGGHTNNR